MMDRRQLFFSVIFFLIIISTMFGSFFFWQSVPEDMKTPDGIKTYILSFGVFAPIVFLFLMMVKVVFGQLLPGQLLGLASGYIFGTFWGTIISMSGLVLGTMIVVWLSRRFGRPFVEFFVSSKILKKFDFITIRRGPITLFLFYLLPAFPDDAITFIAGLTRLPIRTIVVIAALGRLPSYIVLNYIGAGISYGNIYSALILFAVLMIISGFMYLHRQKIEEKMHDVAVCIKRSGKKMQCVVSPLSAKKASKRKALSHKRKKRHSPNGSYDPEKEENSKKAKER